MACVKKQGSTGAGTVTEEASELLSLKCDYFEISFVQPVHQITIEHTGKSQEGGNSDANYPKTVLAEMRRFI